MALGEAHNFEAPSIDKPPAGCSSAQPGEAGRDLFREQIKELFELEDDEEPVLTFKLIVPGTGMVSTSGACRMCTSCMEL